MSIKVRFAPSPTGFLHIGGARTALFNYLFSKSHKGQFVLRIEDTDQQRHQEASIVSILQNLKWLGIEWNEGPFLNSKNQIIYKGSQQSYRQSERLAIYQEQSQKLIQNGKAYYCFLTEEQEAQMREKAIQAGQAYVPSSPYRDHSLKESQKKLDQGQKACIRFKTQHTQKTYTINDLVKGQMAFPSDTIGDFVLMRSDGYPVYSFSCAVDDALMKITHILRGEEHLSNTIKQKLIYESLGLTFPQTGHLSIILGSDKKKLSKRSGAQSIEYFKEEGFLPSALLNFLSLLGWNPGTEQEIFSQKELINAFSVKGLNHSAAIFDLNKLLWMNKEYLKALNVKDLWTNLLPFLKEADIHINKSKTEIKSILKSVRINFTTFKQATTILKHFSEKTDDHFIINPETKEVFSWPKSKQVIQKWESALIESSTTYITLEHFKEIQKRIQKDLSVKGKDFFMPIRCALTGQPEGIEIKILVTLLTRQELIKRAQKLLQSL